MQAAPRLTKKGFLPPSYWVPEALGCYLAPSAIVSGIVFGEADPPYQHALYLRRCAP
jgi:hypothetical protein